MPFDTEVLSIFNSIAWVNSDTQWNAYVKTLRSKVDGEWNVQWRDSLQTLVKKWTGKKGADRSELSRILLSITDGSDLYKTQGNTCVMTTRSFARDVELAYYVHALNLKPTDAVYRLSSERMEHWKSGRMVFGDINGTLYAAPFELVLADTNTKPTNVKKRKS